MHTLSYIVHTIHLKLYFFVYECIPVPALRARGRPTPSPVMLFNCTSSYEKKLIWKFFLIRALLYSTMYWYAIFSVFCTCHYLRNKNFGLSSKIKKKSSQ